MERETRVARRSAGGICGDEKRAKSIWSFSDRGEINDELEGDGDQDHNSRN
jgi:hypothetical protein